MTPWERFKRTIRAMALNDKATVETLRTSCPKVPEILPDPDYRDLVDGTEWWVMVIAIDIVPIIAKLDILDLIQQLNRQKHWQNASRLPESDPLRHMTETLLSQLHTIWDALETVCTTLLEMDARRVLQAEYPPLLQDFDRYRQRWERIPRQESAYAQEVDLLAALWLRFCDPPATPLQAQH